LQGKNGKLFYQEAQESFSVGDAKWVSVVQGKLVTVTGAYSEFISIPAVGVDLSDIKVELGSEEVLQVSADSAESHFGVCGVESGVPLKSVQIPGFIRSLGSIVKVKFTFGNSASGVQLDVSGTGAVPVYYRGEPVLSSFIVQGGVYDFIYDGENWNVSGQSVGAVEVVNGTIKPYGGFYVFYYNGALYVKIFKGPHVIVSSQYRVTFRVSDGVAGNLGVRQFKGYQDSFTFADGKPATLLVQNEDPIVGGVDEPLFYELVAELRRKFFVTTNVASVPEYRTWFLSQPEVFDCLVESDMIRSAASNQTEVSGMVVVYLMRAYLDSSGKRQFEAIVPAVGSNLMRELDKVRDIAPIKFDLYESVYNYYVVQFQSSTDNGKFVEDAKALVSRFYSDVGFIRALNVSLFESFDVSVLSQALVGLYSVTGLHIIPYHFREYEREVFYNTEYLSEEVNGTFWVITAYLGEEAGAGYYEFYGHREGADVNKPPVLLQTFRELLTVDGSVDIYWEDVDSRTYLVGMRSSGRRVLINQAYIPEGVSFVRCFWPIADRGIMPVGVMHGARMLWGVDVRAYS
jgi:hypothetical protein